MADQRREPGSLARREHDQVRLNALAIHEQHIVADEAFNGGYDANDSFLERAQDTCLEREPMAALSERGEDPCRWCAEVLSCVWEMQPIQQQRRPVEESRRNRNVVLGDMRDHSGGEAECPAWDEDRRGPD